MYRAKTFVFYSMELSSLQAEILASKFMTVQVNWVIGDEGIYGWTVLVFKNVWVWQTHFFLLESIRLFPEGSLRL